MNRRYLPAALALCATLLAGSSLLQAKETEHESAKTDAAAAEKDKESPRHLADESKVTQNSITVAGRKVSYQAEAGLLVVHQKDPLDDDPPAPSEHGDSPAPRLPEASMSYVAYFQGDKE